MAALPPSNTARFKFHYVVGSFQHTVQFRTPVSPSVIGSVFSNWVTAMTTILFASSLDFVEFAASGSNIFNIVTTGFEGMSWGTAAGFPFEVARYLDFVGRSSGGRRNRITIFGSKVEGTNYRFVPGENAPVDAGLAVLNGSALNIWAIDGLPTVFKSYVNAGFNVHWQKEVR